MVLSGRVRRRCGFCGCRSHVRGECFVVTSRGVRRECSSFVCPKCMVCPGEFFDVYGVDLYWWHFFVLW